MAASYFKRIVARQPTTRQPTARPLRPAHTVFDTAPAPAEPARRHVTAPTTAPPAPIVAAPLPASPAPPSRPRADRRMPSPSPSPLMAQPLIRPEDVAASAPPARDVIVRHPPVTAVVPRSALAAAPPDVVARPGTPPMPSPAAAPAVPEGRPRGADVAPAAAPHPAPRDDRPSPLLSLETATMRTRDVSPALTTIAKRDPPPVAPQPLKPPPASAPPFVAAEARPPESPAARIEIGAVEVRLAPVEPRPRRATGPVERRGRGFVYPFGLRQG